MEQEGRMRQRREVIPFFPYEFLKKNGLKLCVGTEKHGSNAIETGGQYDWLCQRAGRDKHEKQKHK